MKIKRDELQSETIGDFESIDSSISTDNLGFALKSVSKNLYSNPIGSFIRELTSNAVDANIDAEEESKVMVHIYRDGDSDYIEFKDNGVGMSPEFFRERYMSWFDSDKRDTNAKIGGWGLGSKSPLAYQPSYELSTRKDGIEYTYIIADEGKIPKATPLLEEATDKPNGTTVTVQIKEGDDWQVYKECKAQLAYFDNVYVKDEINYYNNNFTIYESKYFRLRNKAFPYGNDMHICLGQVAYPIDWNVLKINTIRIPVALTFNIGELEVTLSREEISYTKETKAKLLERIELVHQDLIERYKKQLKIDDLFDYIRLVKDSNKPNLIIEDVSIDMKEAKANIYFIPFEGIKIDSKNILDLFSAYNVSEIKNGKKFNLHGRGDQVYFRLYRYTSNSYFVKGDFNYFDTLYLENAFLFKRGRLTTTRFRKLVAMLDLVENKEELKKAKKEHRFPEPIIKQGAAKIIYKVLKYVDEYLEENLPLYDGIAPKDWINELKAAKEEKRKKAKGDITYYNLKNNRINIKLASLVEDYKAIFYIDRKWPKQKLVEYQALYNFGTKEFHNESMFLIVSTTTVKILKKFNNVYPAEMLFKVKTFRNRLYRLKITIDVKKNLRNYQDAFKYSSYYNNLYTKIFQQYKLDGDFYFSVIPNDDKELKSYNISLIDVFKEEIKSIKPSNNRIKLIYEDEIQELKDFLIKANVLHFLKATPHDIIVKLVKNLKIRKLDSIYYDENYIDSEDE